MRPEVSGEEMHGEAPSADWFQIPQNMVRRAGTSAPAARQRAGPGGEVSLLKHKVTATPLYKVRQADFHALITKEEFIARNPGEKLPETATATENRSTTQRIHWRLSHLYREHRNTIVKRSPTKRAGKELPPLKPLRYRRTMKALVLYFFDRVVRHGPSVVPYIDEKDGQKSDDELFQRVLKLDAAQQSGLPLLNMRAVEVHTGQKLRCIPKVILPMIQTRSGRRGISDFQFLWASQKR